MTESPKESCQLDEIIEAIQKTTNNDDITPMVASIILNRDNQEIISSQHPANEKLEDISMNINDIHSQLSSKLNYNLELTMRKVRKQRQIHRMCAQYYECLYSFINIPAIAISGAATVYSFAYPADGTHEQVFINKMIAGSLSALNTILFSMGSILKYQAKAESHHITAEEYDNLLTMINFELRFPNENILEFANKIEKKILEIKKSCRYFPPEFIVKRYDKMNPLKVGEDSLSI